MDIYDAILELEDINNELKKRGVTPKGTDSNEKIPHLSDLINHISHIIVYDDISDAHVSIDESFLLENDDEDDEQDTELFYLQATDEQLKNLDQAIINTFVHPDLLQRLYKLDKSKLTTSQLEILKNEFKQKFIISEEDVKKVVDTLKKCTNVSYSGNHRKTNRFLVDASGNFNSTLCKQVINNLQVSDYVNDTRSINPNYFGDNLMVFMPTVILPGGQSVQVLLYVKLDIDQMTKNVVALVSMHQAERNNVAFQYATQLQTQNKQQGSSSQQPT